MKKVNFIFGLHNHQPVGNFDNVFQHAYEHAYKPFIDVLKKYPEIKLSMHYTGILFDWLEDNHPAFLDTLGGMIASGQVEILSGGYYEPILPSIPDSDKVSQILMLNRYIEKRFGVKPQGMWLAERVWEPQIAKYIADAGIKYIVIDDSHFRCTGMSDEQLNNGYFVTEENGAKLNVFPINKTLRYLMPFRPVHESIEYMAQNVTESGRQLLVMADDGEKFGDWPFTFKSVYEEGWLDQFCAHAIENSQWIEFITFEEYMKKHNPAGRIYLPTASYYEMMEWAMPADKIVLYDKLHKEIENRGEQDDYQYFFKGGFWRNFLAKYDEANFMHKKMLHVSNKVNAMDKSHENYEPALDKLYQGQCNCPYWHGVFGGLYLPHLRTAIYDSLIKSENLADRSRHKTEKWIESEIRDIDCDGNPEIIVNSNVLAVYIKPSYGGSIFELDYKPAYYNLVNTLSRRPESYHQKLKQQNKTEQADDGSIQTINELQTKQQDLDKHLIYDWCLRNLYQEHLVAAGTSVEEYRTNTFRDLGDFVLEPYEFNIEKHGSDVGVFLWRFGHVWNNGAAVPVKIEKNFYFSSGKEDFTVEYRIINCHNTPLDFDFTVACNMSLTAGNDPDRYYIIQGRKLENSMLSSCGAEEEINELSCVDMWKNIKVDLQFSEKAVLYRYPVETISNSEGGVEKIFQNFCVCPSWHVYLEGNGSMVKLLIHQRITKAK